MNAASTTLCQPYPLKMNTVNSSNRRTLQLVEAAWVPRSGQYWLPASQLRFSPQHHLILVYCILPDENKSRKIKRYQN